MVMEGAGRRAARKPGCEGILPRHVRGRPQILPRCPLLPPPQKMVELTWPIPTVRTPALKTSGLRRSLSRPERVHHWKQDKALSVAEPSCAALPVLRKSAMVDRASGRSIHRLAASRRRGVTHVSSQSPGPIYEPGGSTKPDWWRFGAVSLRAAGLGAGRPGAEYLRLSFHPGRGDVRECRQRWWWAARSFRRDPGQSGGAGRGRRRPSGLNGLCRDTGFSRRASLTKGDEKGLPICRGFTKAAGLERRAAVSRRCAKCYIRIARHHGAASAMPRPMWA